ncbi:hypothetical protein [Chitinophaga ginsengisoli]|uniref:Uncharacterized protein n=1 Tax=Chitinophaga ginsengisoli TaxID=363837 RepID=A0A2P8FAQ9_9BACT|nr:hypothetical protein [Chitinophaga ginsengisoli]PSL18817.1 hypothetical protein CLV42_1313 [Chitinophaga ginsengisoli]
MERGEITKRLESENIDEVISAMDIMANELLYFITRSLDALEKNNEWRPFIAERIYKLINNSKCAMDDRFQEQGAKDDDLRFWLSSLLVVFDQNENFILEILHHVINNEDDNEMMGLNILVRKKVIDIDEIIIEKLRKAEFTIKNYYRIDFYLDKLKTLNIGIPEDIIEKINSFHQRVQYDWQKLYY